MVDPMGAPEFWFAVILMGLALILLLAGIRQNRSLITEPFAIMSLCFIPCFDVGTFSVYGYLLMNLLILITGVLTIRKGNLQSDLAELNFGLLIFPVLIFSRLFDSNISFLLRVYAFIVVILGFLMIHYLMYRKKLSYDE